MTNPKALIATANDDNHLLDLYYEMMAVAESKGEIIYTEIRELQVTIVYQPKKTEKAKKVISIKSLNQKAKKLNLSDLMVERVDEVKICIVNQYTNQQVYTCKTPLGISRKLTAIHWERQIKMLRVYGDIK